MTSWITRFLALAAAGVGAALAQAPAFVVGAAVSQSGPHADLAADYRKALVLWQEETNAAGGLLGRRVELVLLDDGSEAIRAGALYRQLIRDDKADALIGPYGTAAAMMAAAEAESARRVIVNGAAASRTLHKRSPRYVFQAGVPYAAAAAGALELARDAGYRRLFIVARDDPVALEMAQAAREAAQRLGLEAGEIQVFGAGTSDFAPQIAAARLAQAQAWIAFGVFRDGAEMVKSFRRLAYAPQLFFLRDAADPKLIPLIGQDAEFTLGDLDYDPRLATPGNERFVKAFVARWSSKPGSAAAAGYAAATVLGEALRRAGSADPDKLRAALASERIATVLGDYQVDAKTGEQTALKPALVEIIKGRAEPVWPQALATAKRVLPYPQWSERKPLK